MEDEKGRDDKIIAVQSDDPEFNHYRDISELPAHKLRELQRFFLDYKVLEHKEVRIENLRGRIDAFNVLKDALLLYRASRDQLLPRNLKFEI